MNFYSLQALLKFKLKHSQTFIIGYSVLNKPIYAIKINFDNSKDCVIIQGAIHAREHITTDLIMKLVYDCSKNYDKLKRLKVPNIIFVPMVNPDGVNICCFGLSGLNKQRRDFIKSFAKNQDLKLYKANANGVDLNNNFDAKWGSSKLSVFKPSFHGFVGRCPMSEPETKALAFLTILVKPIFTISYHSKGEEIYYDFFAKEENVERDLKIAKLISKTTRYKIVSTENSSSGGYKDWCVYKLNIPAVTIEVGNDNLEHPIEKKHLNSIYKRNKNVIYCLAKVRRIFYDTRRNNETSNYSSEKS